MIKSGRQSCMRLCGGLMSLFLLTSILSAQDDRGDTARRPPAPPFSLEPDWLVVSDDTRSGILLTDPLRPAAPGGLSEEVELFDDQVSNAEANPFEADLNRLQMRIDQLEASEASGR